MRGHRVVDGTKSDGLYHLAMIFKDFNVVDFGSKFSGEQLRLLSRGSQGQTLLL
jgi:hypothetical protein